MLSRSVQLLRSLQYPTGLFAAARNSATGYHLAWIRDNIYATFGFEAIGRLDKVLVTLHALLDVLKKHEYKIDWMILQPSPKAAFRYIHARYEPWTGDEISDEWGNKQNDAVGALLFRIGELSKKGLPVLRDENDSRIVQKLVDYLAAIEYWQDKDNGMWEETEDSHASSIGACVAGLKSVQHLAKVDSQLIEKGESALNVLLPSESSTRTEDLALLSLIYPYHIVTTKQCEQILAAVETRLLRERGVIRYIGDKYYCKNECKDSEAEWTVGLPWLAIIYKQLGVQHKHLFYLRKAVAAITDSGELPELYFAGTKIPNRNKPLAWAQSLFVVAALM